jgi:phenylpropionate dioxygenase-like ring-hydroxylating dioxygenase large terminal subunit
MERLFVEIDSAAPLRDMWYYAIPGAQLKPGQMQRKLLLGEPLVLGRAANGGVFALRDICPHRGIPQSDGRFDGQEIECCYHGWRFDRSGRCTAIPSLVRDQSFDLSRIKVDAYPAREVQGNIWVFFGGDPAAAPEIPVLPGIGERGPDLYESVLLPCSIDHAVVGLMDPAHGPFVHRSWWWRKAGSIHEKSKAFAASAFGFTMLRHAPSSNSNAYRLLGGAPETEIIFRLPAIRIEHITAGRHTVMNLTAVTPLSDSQAQINHAIYWNVPLLSVLKPLLRPYVRAFLNQDRAIMVRQAEGLKYDPPLALIDDADTQARWYYRLKAEYARAVSEHRPFVNPVKDRVLRWRS